MRPFVIAALCGFLAACGSKSAEQKLVEDADSAISWTAALQMTGEKWLANSVPSSFVRASIEAAQKEFQKTSKAVAESPADKHLRDAIAAQLEVSRRAADDLKQATEQRDRHRVAEAAARFHAAYEALHAIEDEVQQ